MTNDFDITAVLEQIRTMCAAITGIVRAVSVYPDPVPTLGLPICIVTPPGLVQFQTHTRTYEHIQYNLTISLILANADCKREVAQTAALPFYKRFHDTFSSDKTLGGICDNSNFSHGVSNLRSYIAKKTQPKLTWTLAISHYVHIEE